MAADTLIDALRPLSELAARHPAVRQPLAELGRSLACEYLTCTSCRDSVGYQLSRIGQIARDRAVELAARDAVEAIRGGFLAERSRPVQPRLRLVANN